MNNEVLNENLFKDIYLMYKADVFRLAYSYTQKRVDAEDITQKVFTKIYKNMNNIKEQRNIKNWLLTITCNECKNHLNTFWHKNIKLIDEEEKSKTTNSDYYDLIDSLKKLPQKYRIPIHLYYFYGYQIAEIAKITKCNPNTIKTRLKRAKNFIRIEMEGFNYERF